MSARFRDRSWVPEFSYLGPDESRANALVRAAIADELVSDVYAGKAHLEEYDGDESVVTTYDERDDLWNVVAWRRTTGQQPRRTEETS